MTIEEIMAVKSILELNGRIAEIRSSMDADGADIDALTKEVEAIEQRKGELNAEAEKRANLAKLVAEGKVGTVMMGETMGKNVDVRGSKEYIKAFVNYIKTGKDAECRALLSENVSGGVVPVPTIVDGIVRTAWDNEPLLNRVRKTYLKGNVKVGFELSATDAVVHVEGTAAPAEETLVLGIVNMVPANIKKWITVSNEALELNGEAFLDYIYRELAHKIAKKLADEVVDAVVKSPATATATAPAVPVYEDADGGIADFVNAKALLSDEARDLTVVLSKAVEAKYRAAALGANFALDPFAGMTVVNNDTLGTKVIVGDFQSGVQVNLPNGDDIKFVYDELSLAEKDLVKIVGREMAAVAVVASKRFVVFDSVSE